MVKKAVRYAVVDAFTDTAFKGNPAAVCFLDEEEADEEWMQSVAKEFNISQTTFLTPFISTVDSLHPSPSNDAPNPRFHLRWFTPVVEVKLCGHGTLAAAHFLLTSGLARSNVIEFVTKSGLLTAKKVHGIKQLGTSKISNNEVEESFTIELDFPMIQVVECDSTEIPSIPGTLNGLSIVNLKKTSTAGDLIVELASGKDVADIQPKFDELQKCAGRGVIITGPAPHGSGFDFFSRFFCPKLGINEASPRGGRLDLQLEEETKRVRIQGKAVTVMEGSLLV